MWSGSEKDNCIWNPLGGVELRARLEGAYLRSVNQDHERVAQQIYCRGKLSGRALVLINNRGSSKGVVHLEKPRTGRKLADPYNLCRTPMLSEAVCNPHRPRREAGSAQDCRSLLLGSPPQPQALHSVPTPKLEL